MCAWTGLSHVSHLYLMNQCWLFVSVFISFVPFLSLFSVINSIIFLDFLIVCFNYISCLVCDDSVVELSSFSFFFFFGYSRPWSSQLVDEFILMYSQGIFFLFIHLFFIIYTIKGRECLSLSLSE